MFVDLFLYCFLYLLFLFMIISHITFLPTDIPHTVATETGIANNALPVKDNVIELDVVAIITNVSNDIIIVVSVLNFLYLFFDSWFLSSN